MKNLLILSVLFLASFSCTENQKVRSWGGVGNYDLPKGEQLINVTWKETELWILTKIRPDSVPPQAYKFFSKKDELLFDTDGTFFFREQ